MESRAVRIIRHKYVHLAEQGEGEHDRVPHLSRIGEAIGTANTIFLGQCIGTAKRPDVTKSRSGVVDAAPEPLDQQVDGNRLHLLV